MRRSLFLSTLALFAVVACKPAAEGPEKAERAAAVEEPAPTPDEPQPPEGWTRLNEAALSEAQKAQLAEAKKAQKALASNLMGTLKGAVGEGQWAKGIEACQSAAPAVKAQVSDQYGVKIGRTSFKVRNRDNRPSGWRVPFVEARTTQPVVLAGPAGQLGYMAPIMAKEVCMNCHGAAEKIPAEVKAKLAEAYPKDEATGFAPGDLRGWFWVELSERDSATATVNGRAKPDTADAPHAAPMSVTIRLQSKSGSDVTGTVELIQTDDGVKVVAVLQNVPEGEHGFHVHEKADCSAPDGTSAGGHFDPKGKDHGLPPQEPHHLGDLGNVVAAADGTARKVHIAKGANLKPGDPLSFMGRGLILHAQPDDGGQPTGNAGARIACGEITPPAG